MFLGVVRREGDCGFVEEDCRSKPAVDALADESDIPGDVDVYAVAAHSLHNIVITKGKRTNPLFEALLVAAIVVVVVPGAAVTANGLRGMKVEGSLGIGDVNFATVASAAVEKETVRRPALSAPYESQRVARRSHMGTSKNADQRHDERTKTGHLCFTWQALALFPKIRQMQQNTTTQTEHSSKLRESTSETSFHEISP